MRHQAYMGPGADDGMGPGPTPRLDHFLPAVASIDQKLHQLALGSWGTYPWSGIVQASGNGQAGWGGEQGDGGKRILLFGPRFGTD